MSFLSSTVWGNLMQHQWYFKILRGGNLMHNRSDKMAGDNNTTFEPKTLSSSDVDYSLQYLVKVSSSDDVDRKCINMNKLHILKKNRKRNCHTQNSG